jgi:hypothetical protein
MSNIAISFYHYIPILCAKILRVNRALDVQRNNEVIIEDIVGIQNEDCESRILKLI